MQRCMEKLNKFGIDVDKATNEKRELIKEFNESSEELIKAQKDGLKFLKKTLNFKFISYYERNVLW